jgi:hypothetical protein
LRGSVQAIERNREIKFLSDLVTVIAYCRHTTLDCRTLLWAFSSWLISHRYYIKANADQRAEFSQLSEELRPRNTLRDFEQLVETANWTKTFVDHREVWICNDDNTFQIERGERTREFRERWTTVYPDRSGSADAMYLKIAGTTIKELNVQQTERNGARQQVSKDYSV